jgi:selenocysteine lyase/cysteine desulfurase
MEVYFDNAATSYPKPQITYDKMFEYLKNNGASAGKGLLGPTGTGGLYIKEGINLKPLKTGGTGSNSTAEYPPEELPNRHEAGTINTAGLIALGAGVDYILDKGVEQIRAKEIELIKYTLKSLKEIK